MAKKLLEDCIAVVDREGRYATAQIRYRSFLATALAAMGALEQARHVLEEATDRAEQLGASAALLDGRRRRGRPVDAPVRRGRSRRSPTITLAGRARAPSSRRRSSTWKAEPKRRGRTSGGPNAGGEARRGGARARACARGGRAARRARPPRLERLARDGEPPTRRPATSTRPTSPTTAPSRRSPRAASGGKRSTSRATGRTRYAPPAARSAPTPSSSRRPSSASASRPCRSSRRSASAPGRGRGVQSRSQGAAAPDEVPNPNRTTRTSTHNDAGGILLHAAIASLWKAGATAQQMIEDEVEDATREAGVEE